jgi:hypothetical protein
MNETAGNAQSRVYDRVLLLHGSRRNEMLTLAEIEQYGLIASPTPTTSASTQCRRENGTATASVCSAARR